MSVTQCNAWKERQITIAEEWKIESVWEEGVTGDYSGSGHPYGRETITGWQVEIFS